MTTEQQARPLSAASAADSWRPQKFSEGRATEVHDPLVEPLWMGLRVLALVDDGRVLIRDSDGDPIEDFPDVVTELAQASRVGQLLVDGYLTHQPIQGIDAVAYRETSEPMKSAPTIGQLWFGRFGSRRSREKPPPVEAVEREVPPDKDVALVVVDLLWLDDEPMLTVPLLERKRILESVLEESHLVRRGIFVRPPIDTWVGSWRSFGFSRLAYKGANSRYTPGATNPEWAVGDLPAR